ncbi:MAG: radical SAM protein [Candidatus Helarchaeales archaeon]
MNSPDKIQELTNAILDGPSALYKVIGPKSIQFEITNNCNVRCIMCDRWKWNLKEINRPELSTSEIIKLMDELKALETQHVLISGGEPFLRPDIWEVIEHVVKSRMALTIITNGTSINKEKMDVFKKGKISLTFSIDGCDEASYSKIRGVKGAFERIINNLKKIIQMKEKNRRLNVTWHFVLQHENANKVRETALLASRLGVDTISFGLVHGPHVKDRGIVINHDDLKIITNQFKQIMNDVKQGTCLEPTLRPELLDLLLGKLTLSDVMDGLLALPLFRKQPLPCYSLSYWALIDAFGDVYPCCYAYFDNLDHDEHDARRKKFILGSIREQTFSEIWNGNRFNELRKKLNPVNVDDMPEVCGNCGSYHFFKELDKNFQEMQDVFKKMDSSRDEKTRALFKFFSCFMKKPDRSTTSFEEEMKAAFEKLE